MKLGGPHEDLHDLSLYILQCIMTMRMSQYLELRMQVVLSVFPTKHLDIHIAACLCCKILPCRSSAVSPLDVSYIIISRRLRAKTQALRQAKCK